MISWLSNIVPIIGYFKYRDLTNKIIKNSNRYNRIIQDPEVNAKSKEDILYDNLVSVPLKEKCWGFDFKKI